MINNIEISPTVHTGFIIKKLQGGVLHDSS